MEGIITFLSHITVDVAIKGDRTGRGSGTPVCLLGVDLITQRRTCCYVTAVSHCKLQLHSAGKFSTWRELESLSF